MFRRLIIVLIFGCLVMYGCDPGTHVNFSIINKARQPLIVKYKVGWPSHDTSISIALDSTRVIYSENQLGYVNMVTDKLDSIPLDSPRLRRGDNYSTLNLKDKKLWKLQVKNNVFATYNLVVDSSYFNH